MASLATSLFPLPTTSKTPDPIVTPGPSVVYQNADITGHRTLWVVCVIMGLSSLAFYVMSYRVPVQKRLFHILTAFITTFAFISYFAMASGDGISYSSIVRKDGADSFTHIHRQVYWARYVDWALTTPLLLLDLAFLAGLSGADMFVAVVADLIMVIVGLFAALSDKEKTSWGYYVIACIAYLVVVYQLAIQGRRLVLTRDRPTATFFSAIAGFTLVLWTLYPIVWGLADGSRSVGVDAEIVLYAILDVLAKPVFGFWLLFTHDAMASSSVSIEGFWSSGLAKDGALRVGDDEEGA